MIKEPQIVKIKGSRGESWSSKFWRDVALRTLNETRPYRGAVNKQLANNGCDNDEHENNKKWRVFYDIDAGGNEQSRD